MGRGPSSSRSWQRRERRPLYVATLAPWVDPRSSQLTISSLSSCPYPSRCASGGFVALMLNSPTAHPRSASYKAVLPTFRRVAASSTVSPLSMMSRARLSFSAVITGLRPPFRPRASAAARPARVRSRIRSRSNSPSARQRGERSACRRTWWYRSLR